MTTATILSELILAWAKERNQPDIDPYLIKALQS
jgi:hypothetical protein